MDSETLIRLLTASDTALVVRTAGSVLLIIWGGTRAWALIVRTMDGAQTTVVSNAGKLVKLQQGEITRLAATCQRLDREMRILQQELGVTRSRARVAAKTAEMLEQTLTKTQEDCQRHVDALSRRVAQLEARAPSES